MFTIILLLSNVTLSEKLSWKILLLSKHQIRDESNWYWWSSKWILDNLQKQPQTGVPRKRCFENMQQIYRKTPMTKCDFSNFIEISLRHGCSPVNLLHIFRTPFPKNISGRLLLNLVVQPCAKLWICLAIILWKSSLLPHSFSNVVNFWE